MITMIQLAFPPVHKLVEKDQSSFEEGDPRKGVLVIENHAVVMTFNSLVCVDLEQYFTVKEKKNSMEDVENMNDIFKFMNNKLFGVGFWAELTKNAIMSVRDGKLHLEGMVRKDLYNDYKEYTTKDLIRSLGNVIDQEPVGLRKVGLSCRGIYQLLKTFGTTVQKDSIALEFVGTSSACKFTFEKNPWIFGLLDQDPVFASQEFLYEDLNAFYSSLKITQHEQE